MRLLARIAMVFSVGLLAAMFIYLWSLPLTGREDAFWAYLNLPGRNDAVPTGPLVIGWLSALNAIAALVGCYLSVNGVLSASSGDLFRSLAIALRQLSWRLIYFWISYGAATALATEYTAAAALGTWDSNDMHNWNPMGINSVFLVLGIAFRPISSAMMQAEQVAAENRSFV